MPNSQKQVTLEWSKLLGFDQITRVGSKVGDKGRAVIGSKVSVKPTQVVGASLGAKVGTKVLRT